MDAERHAAKKFEWLEKQLHPWKDRLEYIRFLPEALSWGYRDKVCLGAQWKSGRWNIGLRHGDNIIDIPDCPIHTPRIRNSLKTITNILPRGYDFPLVYYVQSGALVTLVLKTRALPDPCWLNSLESDRCLTKAGIEGLWLHLHPCAGKKVFAKHGWHLAWGRPYGITSSGRIYGPTTFRQVMAGLHYRAVRRAWDFLALSEDDLVFDLYSGIGETLALWTKHCATVFGVELSGEAVFCAKQNAPQAEIFRGSCTHRIPQLIDAAEKWKSSGKSGNILVYANPPRTGLEPETADWIVNGLNPAKIVCLSCNPKTLFYDLKRLEKGGLGVIRLIPYDFFPHTHHVEILALLG